ncbi:MAG: hypothetical protein ACETWT_01235, partial [Thermodesulfobacteriota bacterium]
FLSFMESVLLTSSPPGNNIFHGTTTLSLRFHTSEVTLSGFAGREYIPLPASEGLAFPLRSAELTSKPFDFALRSEQFGLELTAERLRVEDSGQALLTLEGYPTSPADYAQGQ